jgi:hypothetical protein
MDVEANGRGTVETEVVPKAKRRRFSAKYKRRILREAAECTKVGELSAPLRRQRTTHVRCRLRPWRRLRPRSRQPMQKFLA